MTTTLSSIDLQRLLISILAKQQSLGIESRSDCWSRKKYAELYDKIETMRKEAEDAEKIPVQVAALHYDEARSKGETSVSAMRIALHALADKLETETDRDACAVYLRVAADEEEEE